MEIAPLLSVGRGVTAIIGSGGKTTLLYTLAEELKEKGKVIICTTTRIRIPDRYQTVTGGVKEILSAMEDNDVVCAGTPAESGKIGTSSVTFEELTGMADYVLTEADGSRGLPLKAHAGYEPVIPEISESVIHLIGADGIGGIVSEVCHRPELWTEITGGSLQDRVTPDDIAHVIDTEDLGGRYFINKVDDGKISIRAEELAALLPGPVVMGSLQKGEYSKWE